MNRIGSVKSNAPAAAVVEVKSQAPSFARTGIERFAGILFCTDNFTHFCLDYLSHPVQKAHVVSLLLFTNTCDYF
jgi:hypothetical protein